MYFYKYTRKRDQRENERDLTQSYDKRGTIFDKQLLLYLLSWSVCRMTSVKQIERVPTDNRSGMSENNGKFGKNVFTYWRIIICLSHGGRNQTPDDFKSVPCWHSTPGANAP